MDAIERRAILQALEKTGGNRTQAAEMLGIGLGYPGSPHVVARFMAAKSEREIARGRVIALTWAVLVVAVAGVNSWWIARDATPYAQPHDPYFYMVSTMGAVDHLAREDREGVAVPQPRHAPRHG